MVDRRDRGHEDWTIIANIISGGPIGLAWFQYDATAGTSNWTDNDMTDTTQAGIYVSPSDAGGATRESFTITANTIAHNTTPHWMEMNLHPTTGTYAVSQNLLG